MAYGKCEKRDIGLNSTFKANAVFEGLGRVGLGE